jgi:hypothetical protein
VRVIGGRGVEGHEASVVLGAREVVREEAFELVEIGPQRLVDNVVKLDDHTPVAPLVVARVRHLDVGVTSFGHDLVEVADEEGATNRAGAARLHPEVVVQAATPPQGAVHGDDSGHRGRSVRVALGRPVYLPRRGHCDTSRRVVPTHHTYHGAVTDTGWRPLAKPTRGKAPVTVVATPFTRFARVHTLSSLGDGLVTIALAGSIFFSVDPSAAREKVALYLFLTIAPFAVVTPLIGPAVDRARGGRRTMVLASTFGRAVVAFLMVGHIHSLLLFPEAFAMLVLQKTYVIANRALVPKLVDSEQQLVEANSKLALLSAVGSMGGAAFGALLAVIGGPGWSAAMAFVLFVVGGLASLQLPLLTVAEQPAGVEERRELRGSTILLAGSAMGVMRGIGGFMTFLLAFEFRGGKEGVDVKPLGAAVGASTAIVRKIDITGDPRAPAWHFGAVVLGAGIGALVGARIAPALRRRVAEERIVLGVLIATAIVGLVATWNGRLFGAFLLSLMVALAAGAGKLAFDSLVQRDAPDANYGRSFARFEARFQLTWVIGAFIPVVLPFRARYGYALVTIAATVAAATYIIGVRTSGRPRVVAARLGRTRRQSSIDPTTARTHPDPTSVFPRPDPTLVTPWPMNDHTGPAAPPEQRAPEPPAQEEPAPAPPPPVSSDEWGSVPSMPVVSAGDGVHVERTRRADADRES